MQNIWSFAIKWLHTQCTINYTIEYRCQSYVFSYKFIYINMCPHNKVLSSDRINSDCDFIYYFNFPIFLAL